MPVLQNYTDVHVDRPLTNLSIAHWQDTSLFVASRFFTVQNVNNASDTYTTYPQGYFNRTFNTRRDEEGVANSIGYGSNEDRYSVSEDALRIFISDKKRANADSHRNLDMEATRVTTDALLLGKEAEFNTNFLTTSKWSVDRTGVASGPTGNQFIQWSDYTNSDPISDVKTATTDMVLRSGGRRPNRALMTLDVWQALSEHPDIIDRIKFTSSNDNPAIVNVRAMAALMELDEIMIMQTVVNNADDGVEDSGTGLPAVNNQFVASKVFLLAHVAPTGLYSATAGITFVWNQYIGLGVDGGPAIRRYRPQDGRKGEYIEAEMAIDQKLVSADLGQLFSSVIA